MNLVQGHSVKCVNVGPHQGGLFVAMDCIECHQVSHNHFLDAVETIFPLHWRTLLHTFPLLELKDYKEQQTSDSCLGWGVCQLILQDPLLEL